jgi:enoyl-CoA hydratase/carnithine racemase
MEEIITELSGNVLRVQFNRPSKKNAMTVAMYAALAEELDRADKNDDVRVRAGARRGRFLHGRQRLGGFHDSSSWARR